MAYGPVLRWIKMEFVGMKHLQTSSLQRGHEISPLVHCLAVDPEVSGHGRSVSLVELENVSAEHMLESTVVDNKVKCSGPSIISPGLHGSTLGYRPMGNPKRIVKQRPFNGWVIRDIRKERHLSQEQLAALAGMKKANVSKLERARSHVAMSYENFLDLSRALYVTPEELRRRLSEISPSGPTTAAGRRA